MALTTKMNSKGIQLPVRAKLGLQTPMAPPWCGVHFSDFGVCSLGVWAMSSRPLWQVQEIGGLFSNGKA